MSSQITMDSIKPILQTYSVLALALAAGKSSAINPSYTSLAASSTGTNLSSTIVTLPALLSAPAGTLATQWKVMFDSGIAPMASLSTTSAAGLALLAYHAPTVTSASLAERNLYIAAAVGAASLGPYTKILMGSNIEALEKRAKAAAEGQEKGDTHELVRTWGRYNFFRGLMLLSAAGCGMWASLS
jgi:hypothetical protein